MSNPFPGMNPFLERHWGDVHTSLVTYAREYIQPQLPQDLCARIEEYVHLDVEGDPDLARPDVRIVAEPPDLAPVSVVESGVQLAEPVLVRLQDETHVERRVVILDSDGRRIVTSIEILSPSNKRSRREREGFRAKQRDLLDGGASLVEIDLIRQGQWTLPVPQRGLPDEFACGTGVCVVRAWDPAGRECYPTPLDRRLPAIRVPLRETDADVALDLQNILDRTWSVGRFRLDYERQPWPHLTADDDAYARELLREKGLLASVDSDD